MARTRSPQNKKTSQLAHPVREFLRGLLRTKVKSRADKEKLARFLGQEVSSIESMLYYGEGGLDSWVGSLVWAFSLKPEALEAYLARAAKSVHASGELSEADEAWFEVERQLSEQDKLYWAGMIRASRTVESALRKPAADRKIKSPILRFVEGTKVPANCVPFYDLHIAAGRFGEETMEAAPEGWVKVSRKGSLKEHFAARVSGDSMEPLIPDGSLCLFKKYTGGTRVGKIMLVRAKGLAEGEGDFVLKRYTRVGKGARATIILESENPHYDPIALKGHAEGDIETPCEWLDVLAD